MRTAASSCEPPAGREEIGISAATSIGTTRLAVDNTVTPTGRGSTMILLGSTNPPQSFRIIHKRSILRHGLTRALHYGAAHASSRQLRLPKPFVACKFKF
jgi:hypothetical protein